MKSAIKPDDYVHHGQRDNLLGHGREQGKQWLDEQRRMTLLSSFASYNLVQLAS